ncbi:hypothetical protein ACI8AG_01010 [Blastococcus sp. SYSU DS0552]
MDERLGTMGTEHAEHRTIDIRKRQQVRVNYRLPWACTSPFAPIRTTEMVRRQQRT